MTLDMKGYFYFSMQKCKKIGFCLSFFIFAGISQPSFCAETQESTATTSSTFASADLNSVPPLPIEVERVLDGSVMEAIDLEAELLSSESALQENQDPRFLHFRGIQELQSLRSPSRKFQRMSSEAENSFSLKGTTDLKESCFVFKSPESKIAARSNPYSQFLRLKLSIGEEIADSFSPMDLNLDEEDSSTQVTSVDRKILSSSNSLERIELKVFKDNSKDLKKDENTNIEETYLITTNSVDQEISSIEIVKNEVFSSTLAKDLGITGSSSKYSCFDLHFEDPIDLEASPISAPLAQVTH